MSQVDSNEQLAQLASQAEPQLAAQAEGTTEMIFMRVGGRWFGIEAASVREVTARGGITRVPTAPAHVLGVMLVRGRLVPVVSLDDIAGDVASDETTQALPRVVVIQHEDLELGVAADQIRGVVNMTLHPAATSTRSAERAPFLRDEIEWEGRLVCLIDPGALLANMMQGH